MFAMCEMYFFELAKITGLRNGVIVVENRVLRFRPNWNISLRNSVHLHMYDTFFPFSARKNILFNNAFVLRKKYASCILDLMMTHSSFRFARFLFFSFLLRQFSFPRLYLQASHVFGRCRFSRVIIIYILCHERKEGKK